MMRLPGDSITVFNGLDRLWGHCLCGSSVEAPRNDNGRAARAAWIDRHLDCGAEE